MIKIFLNKIPRSWLIQLSYVVRPFLALFYFGSRFTDPIDGKSFRKFLPYGYAKQRQNVLSPSTLSLERHRLLWIFLKTTSFFTEKLKVLHFAPEQAFYKRFKKLKNLDYTTTDLNSPLADVKADICNLPFKDEEFDVVLCNHVLEHIPDDTKAMQEIFRILKKGGWAVLQIPLDRYRKETFSDNTITCPKKRTEIFGQYDHLRLYGMDFFQKLEKVGFKVEKIECQNLVLEENIQKFRLDKQEIIPICYKI